MPQLGAVGVAAMHLGWLSLLAGRGYSEQQSMFWRIKVELHILRCISTLGQMRIYSISSSSTNVIGFSEAMVGFAGRCSGTSGKQEKGSPTLTQGAAWFCARLLAGDSRHAITERVVPMLVIQVALFLWLSTQFCYCYCPQDCVCRHACTLKGGQTPTITTCSIRTRSRQTSFAA